jgi:hypothetical protein
MVSAATNLEQLSAISEAPKVARCAATSGAATPPSNCSAVLPGPKWLCAADGTHAREKPWKVLGHTNGRRPPVLLPRGNWTLGPYLVAPIWRVVRSKQSSECVCCLPVKLQPDVHALICLSTCLSVHQGTSPVSMPHLHVCLSVYPRHTHPRIHFALACRSWGVGGFLAWSPRLQKAVRAQHGDGGADGVPEASGAEHNQKVLQRPQLDRRQRRRRAPAILLLGSRPICRTGSASPRLRDRLCFGRL